MSYTLATYGGTSVQVVTPSTGLSAAGTALNGNFEFLVDHAFLPGASVSDGVGNSVTVCSYSLAATGTGITLATGQGANSYDAISFPGSTYLSGNPLMTGGSPRVLAAVIDFTGVGQADIVGQLPTYFSDFTGFALQTNGTGIFGFMWGETWGPSGTLSAGFNVIAMVYDGTNAHLYINGTSVASFAPGSIDTAPNPFCVGGQSDYSYADGGAFTGKIGDVVLLDGLPTDLSDFLASLHDRWFGTDSFDPTAWGVPVGVWFDPNQGVTTDGSGNVITWSARIGTGTALIVDGKTSLDTGAITTDGSGKVTAAKLNLYSLPTSSSGLSSGDVWNDSGTLKIV